MTDQPLGSRFFTLEDQLAFARLSLDWNPMHLDANFARRTQAGAPLVHGIHNLLWALDTTLRSFAFDIQNIKARFQQPLFPGELARIELRSRTETAIHIEVIAGGTVIAAIRLSSEPGKLSGSSARGSEVAPQTFAAPADIPFEQLAHQAGAVAAAAGDAEIRKLFPAVSSSIGVAAVQGLLATSRIVGMACPGLHSLFAGLDVSRDRPSDGERALRYAVGKTDARFRSLQIDVAGSGIAGRLDAFARPAPPSQAAMRVVSARVTKHAFAGQRALVVGGSRGLGEITAKNPRGRRRLSGHHLPARPARGRSRRRRNQACRRTMRRYQLRCAGARRRPARRPPRRRQLLLLRHRENLSAQVRVVRTGKAAHVLALLCGWFP